MKDLMRCKLPIHIQVGMLSKGNGPLTRKAYGPLLIYQIRNGN